VIHGCISINGRTWKKGVHCDYMGVGADNRRHMRVGQIADFVLVSYKHKDFERKRRRLRQSTLQGEIMFARLRQYHPQPVRDANLWVAPTHLSFRVGMYAIPIHDLCAYLHRAPERSGRVGYVNLVTVAMSFVNE
jgi:hypothetical protein